MSKNYLWDYETINAVHVELTTYCNAGCPMCPRHIGLPDRSSLPVVRPDLVLESISFENFQKWFPPEFASRVGDWVFCGTHGDPMMNKDILEILRYVCQFGCGLHINTNGGMRNDDFWKELAEITTKIGNRENLNRLVTFSMDGLWDTNHLYRRNVPFEKAFSHAKAFIDAGGRASWDFLIFKHNEHQIEEAAKLATDNGFKFFVPKKALGFQPNGDGTWLMSKVVRNSQGDIDYIIDPPTDENNTNFNKFSDKLSRITPDCEPNFKPDKYLNFLKENKNEMNSYEYKKSKYLEIMPNYTLREEEKCTNVICKAHLSHIDNPRHEIYVDAYGKVFPCCYVATHYLGNFIAPSSLQLNLSIDEFGLDRISLKHHTLKEIIDNGFLQNNFEDRWGKSFENGGMMYCNDICGDKSSIDKIYTHGLDNRPDALKQFKIIKQQRDTENN